MRIAVAGTGGLARLIAHYIDEDTSHHVVFLSRSQQPQLSSAGYQVAVIDYSEPETLRFALRGIDTVISTVTGPNQIQLIQAAVAARVRRFAPAEFEGPPRLRAANDPLDRGRSVARQWLNHYAQNIQSTAFVCGILYERFQPGGLAQSQIGMASGFSGEGDYIMNCRLMTAQAPAYDHNNEPNATICMTAAQDVARFVTQSLDLRTWPSELRMHGQRIQVKDFVLQVQRLTGRPFDIQWHGPVTLRAEMQVAVAQNDNARQTRLRTLMNTCEGRYDFDHSNLNQMFGDIQPIDFDMWFTAKWNPQQL
ncbi:hypothetical protein M409DRAFT_64855 [Zasmidium cellare ATCC 36951]|uniref:NAD(P)-binding domain-containing protein n=1 Tax=Zasmidium cellare ATCC 36951 TaxID=1080233 RepID=A0A6A6CS08_ZASCE|nr:uncharacterized protein M409DRAFT_64855 [Zasmidium cellare ATCC 36951]KAF2169871.1 hypothetical protein M409DRAFT_64855 [Zasmidium cellare ATCC 36951]